MIDPKPETDIPLKPKVNTYTAKLKHIIPTFLIVVFATVIGLAAFRWLFHIRFPILDIKEEIWVVWIPCIVPCIPITLWLRQRGQVDVEISDSLAIGVSPHLRSPLLLCGLLCRSASVQ
jgi:hypothetical protein